MAIDNAAKVEEKEPLILTESDDTGTESEFDSTSGSEKRDIKLEDDTLSSSSSSPQPDPRFHQPAPSPFKRVALIVTVLLLLWLALSLRQSLWTAKKSPKVIYASRYSKEHKYRPAASPIITETLKDGRIRIRGAGPTATPEPRPTPMVPKRPKRKFKSKAKATPKVKSPLRRSTKKPS